MTDYIKSFCVKYQYMQIDLTQRDSKEIEGKKKKEKKEKFL